MHYLSCAHYIKVIRVKEALKTKLTRAEYLKLKYQQVLEIKKQVLDAYILAIL